MRIDKYPEAGCILIVGFISQRRIAFDVVHVIFTVLIP